MKKLRIAFLFVEAGLGHIMPMRAISDAFEKKYGDRIEIVRTRFYKDTNNPDLKHVEDEHIKEVLLHNKHKYKGVLQHLGLNLFGFRVSMAYLNKVRYRRGYNAAIERVKELDADLIFSTHYSTAYYACEARENGIIPQSTSIITYCTDPIVGKQWDYRSDCIGVSSALGKTKAQKSRLFRHTPIIDVPFLIRSDVKNMTKTKEEYKAELGLPTDRFTILLADGAYGAGRLEKTVLRLLNSKLPLNIIAACGKNEALKERFEKLLVPDNIFFMPVGFTDKMLSFAAACDLFMGKAGSSNLAEPIYFGAPTIVTFCATFVEKWICAHQVNNGCAIKEFNVERAVRLAESFALNPSLMQNYVEACKKQKNCMGAEEFADMLYTMLVKRDMPLPVKGAAVCTTI